MHGATQETKEMDIPDIAIFQVAGKKVRIRKVIVSQLGILGATRPSVVSERVSRIFGFREFTEAEREYFEYEHKPINVGQRLMLLTQDDHRLYASEKLPNGKNVLLPIVALARLDFVINSDDEFAFVEDVE